MNNNLKNISIFIRELIVEDFNKGYIELLNQLTSESKSSITYDDFKEHYNKINNNSQRILIIEDMTNNKIIASGTILIEYKLIHNFSTVAHIEDVIVDSKYRGMQLGHQLICALIEVAKDNKCYKVILNCNITNIKFYNKLGFYEKEKQMRLDLQY
jgi:glucosamine-phosphate N-acetyltransferase